MPFVIGVRTVARHGTHVMRTLFASAVLLVSCAHGTVLHRERQEQATWLVWHTVYGREDMPPAVRWVEGDELSCSLADGAAGFPTLTGCKSGWTMSRYEVSVAWWPGSTYGDTSLAHEYWHALQLREGTADPLHLGQQWLTVPECPVNPRRDCAIVDRARQALGEAGL